MLRITTEWTGVTGAPYYTNFFTGGNTIGEAVALANATTGLWEDCSNFISDELSAVIPNEVTRVDPATGEAVGLFAVTGSTIPMGDAGDPLAWATQGLVRIRTAVYAGGREIRGRCFVPGPTEVMNTLGTPDPVYVSSIQSRFETFGGAAAPAGGIGVYSPTHRIFAPGNLFSVWDQWAVLRSRRD
jgi:hypothetical protein